MGTEIIAALIAAVASLAVALFSVFSSREAKKIASRAEEATKRSEQIRVKATESGEKLLTALADVLIASETVEFILAQRSEKVLTQEETTTYFEPIGTGAAHIKRLLYSSAIYLSPEVRESIEDLLRPIFQGRIDFTKWGQFLQNMRREHSQIAKLFRETYLTPLL
jgi:H+/gluconate symporter-like permease